MDIDYYAVLGVPPDASKLVIQEAYRKLIKQYHPDNIEALRSELESKGVKPESIEMLLSYKSTEAEAKSREINVAYAVLSDRTQRREFHNAWKAAKASQASAAQSRPLPKLVVTPTDIYVGKLSTAKSLAVEFTITNTGGPVTGTLEIKDWNNVDWITDQQVKPDPLNVFPIKASFKIDPTKLKPGKYRRTIPIETDGSRAEFQFKFEILEATQTPPPNLVVAPNLFRFKKLKVGQIKEVEFTITNTGGPVTGNLEIKKWNTIPWIKNQRIKPAWGKYFPIAFPVIGTFTIDTNGLKPGTYREVFVIETDSSQEQFEVEIEVIDPPKLVISDISKLRTLVVGEEQTVHFVVDNVGGSTQGQVRITGLASLPWITDLSINPLMAHKNFPLLVRFKINSKSLVPDIYSMTIHAVVDDVHETIQLSFAVRAPQVPPSPKPSVPSYPTPTISPFPTAPKLSPKSTPLMDQLKKLPLKRLYVIAAIAITAYATYLPTMGSGGSLRVSYGSFFLVGFLALLFYYQVIRKLDK